MHYMRSMAYMQWQTHPAGAVRLDFQFNNDMTHQTTRWHDYTMPCLTRRWHASLTHVHDAMPLADHNGMHHWHTMACMTTMHAGVLPTLDHKFASQSHPTNQRGTSPKRPFQNGGGGAPRKATPAQNGPTHPRTQRNFFCLFEANRSNQNC